MSAEVLDKLFGSSGRVKVLRLFLLNEGTIFTPRNISRRTKLALLSARREISLLIRLDFVKKKSQNINELIHLKNGEIKNKRKRVEGYELNGSFPYLDGLRGLILHAVPLQSLKLNKLFRSSGNIKLIVVSGFLIHAENSRIDLLLVGDALKRGTIEKNLKTIEAELGKELSYAVFTTQEFLYRLEMCDKFVRDVLDYPHEKIINKLNI